jgi:Na+(H+)/acetate symporter ActP
MKELVRRWNAPTPKFWKKVRRNGAVLGIVGGLIAKVNPIIGGVILTIGTTISAIAQLTEE